MAQTWPKHGRQPHAMIASNFVEKNAVSIEFGYDRSYNFDFEGIVCLFRIKIQIILF